MRKYKIFALLCLLSVAAFSQSLDTSIKLNDLRAPISPASTLLGIAASEVENPTDPHKLMLSFQNAFNNFTTIPSSYAIDIAPFKLFTKKGMAIKDIDSKEFGKVFQQSLVWSTAIKQITKENNKEDTIATTQLGLGFKFALARGKVNDDFATAISTIRKLQSQLLKPRTDGQLDACIENNPKYKQIEELIKKAQQIGADFTALREQKEALAATLREGCEKSLLAEDAASLKAAIKKEIEAVTLARHGFFMDFAGGLSLNFRENDFNNSHIHKGGAWLTLGYDGKEGVSFSGILRYLYSPDVLMADPKLSGKDQQTFDAGQRLTYKTADKKFSLSVEAIYRSVMNNRDIPTSWRVMSNAEYEIGNNQRLTLSFGRNFDGTYYRTGNVVSALNFIVGLGKQQVKAD